MAAQRGPGMWPEVMGSLEMSSAFSCRDLHLLELLAFVFMGRVVVLVTRATPPIHSDGRCGARMRPAMGVAS